MLTYEPSIERLIGSIVNHLKGDYPFHKRSVAILLLQEDPEIWRTVAQREGKNWSQIETVLQRRLRQSPRPAYIIAQNRLRQGTLIGDQVISYSKSRPSLTNFLDQLTLWPPTAYPLALALLYFGLYRFVGRLGAGSLVDFLEREIFSLRLLPLVQSWIAGGPHWFQEFLLGDFGLLSLGLRYAVAIILPIVASFFFFFSLLEDTGYLPRLALLCDRLCKELGLNGRAVIPLTLGLGCATMATIVTRTLESNRERIIATFLLALAIPCSAQLGLILALLSHSPPALVLYVLIMALVFLGAGQAAHRFLPGEISNFYMELPPLRWPVLSNIVMKTTNRITWYLKEIIPVFIAVSLTLYGAQTLGFLPILMESLQGPMTALGLPPELGRIFLLGFFRRDYGAAGLYDLQEILTPQQLMVAATTLTLFVPCLAQVSVMVKERGLLATTIIIGLVFSTAFGTGFLLNLLLGG
ncbi:MAG: nucleoside recognition domain-containing protein [Limnochordia bacterium]|jgi:ferrous iron transport protein B